MEKMQLLDDICKIQNNSLCCVNSLVSGALLQVVVLDLIEHNLFRVT